MKEEAKPPEGYVPLPRTGGFTELIGPLFSREEGENFSYAFETTQKLQSRSGNVHGGFMMMAADHIISLDILRRKDRPYHIATVQLDSHFIDRAPMGIHLIARPRILRRTRHLIFTDIQIYGNDRLLFQASGIWKIVDPNSRVARKVGDVILPELEEE